MSSIPPATLPLGFSTASRRTRNGVQMALLMAAVTLIMAVALDLVLGWPGVLVALIFAFLMLAIRNRLAPDAVMRLYRGQPVDAVNGHQLLDVVEDLSARAGLSAPPKVFVIPSLTMNAFAVGAPDNAAVAVTEGLVRRLSLREIAAVLAHELSHIRQDDLTVMGFADVLGRFNYLLFYSGLALAIVNVARMLRGEDPFPWLAVILLYLAPALVNLLELSLSRAREFDADRGAATLMGETSALVSALARVDGSTGRFIEDLMLPVPGRRISAPSLLRSHPSTGERIERLNRLELSTLPPPLPMREAPMVSLVGHGPGELEPRYRWPGLWY